MPAMPSRGLADLHLHTCFSDGWPTPTDLVEYVRASTRLDVIAGWALYGVVKSMPRNRASCSMCGRMRAIADQADTCVTVAPL